MITSFICTHPQGIKPICACGMNMVCPICGFGYGAQPCNCSRKTNDEVNATVEKYKDRFHDAWKKLAE